MKWLITLSLHECGTEKLLQGWQNKKSSAKGENREENLALAQIFFFEEAMQTYQIKTV